jgi:5-keto 4-deoxyuronate isomerase
MGDQLTKLNIDIPKHMKGLDENDDFYIFSDNKPKSQKIEISEYTSQTFGSLGNSLSNNELVLNKLIVTKALSTAEIMVSLKACEKMNLTRNY